MRRNIAIFGRTGSGKSEVSSYLVEKYHYQHCHPGKLCREISLRLFQSDAKTILNQVNDAMRAIDPNVWLSAGLRDCSTTMPIVVDGMRFESNYQLLNSRGFWLWRVTADAAHRKSRLEERGQTFDWANDTAHPGEIELERRHFQVEIANDAGRDELRALVDKLMRADE